MICTDIHFYHGHLFLSPHGTMLMAFAGVKYRCLQMFDGLVSTHPDLTPWNVCLTVWNRHGWDWKYCPSLIHLTKWSRVFSSHAVEVPFSSGKNFPFQSENGWDSRRGTGLSKYKMTFFIQWSFDLKNIFLRCRYVECRHAECHGTSVSNRVYCFGTV